MSGNVSGERSEGACEGSGGNASGEERSEGGIHGKKQTHIHVKKRGREE